MSNADKRQVGGDHYKKSPAECYEHWNWAYANNLDFFQYQITKYVSRWKDKNGIQDLEKAQHFLEKYIELERDKLEAVEEGRSEADIIVSRRREGGA